MVSERFEGQDAKTRRWLSGQRICEGDKELDGYELRILLKVRELGYDSFQEFLAQHSVDEKTGATWSLSDQAEALDVPRTPYIRYHTRWVEKNAPRGALK